jgi:hypothetical protein
MQSALDEDLEGELTMDLATPLQPTILTLDTPPNAHEKFGAEVDPQNLPQPESPPESSSVPIIEMERIKYELASAQEQAHATGRSLSNLLVSMSGLEVVEHGSEVLGRHVGYCVVGSGWSSVKIYDNVD